MDDIKKAAPPIPRDALKQPSHEVESPFDVISSAPKPEAPKAKQKLAMPQWLGRPILHPDHEQQLEMNAAINEFGMKMPRQQAEDQAYKDYLYHPKTGQYAQAAHHHLLGVKAADAAGDKEAARKHYMMLNMHAKALGKTPDDLARELGSGEGQDLPKVYKFKAHKGDAFALQPPPSMSHDLQPSGVYASSPKPELTKSQEEKLHKLYDMASELLKKAEDEDVIPCFCCGDMLSKHVGEEMECLNGDGVYWHDIEPLEKARTIRSIPGEQLHGQQVRAYRNLHNGLYSLKNTQGRVIAHVPEVHLDNPRFIVGESGRQRVLREKKKNVHAVVAGTYHHNPEPFPTEGIHNVTYNPYMHPPTEKGHFVNVADKSPILNAKRAYIGLEDKPEGGKRSIMRALPYAEGETPPKLPRVPRKPMTKKEMASAKKHAEHCHCNAYGFCHRYGGGRCNAVKP